MKKKMYIGLLAAASSLLVACQDMTPVRNDQTQEATSGVSQNADNQSNNGKSAEHVQLMTFWVEQFNKLSGIESDVTQEFEIDGVLMTRTAHLIERYEKGSIKQYLSSINTKVNDESLEQSVYFSGEKFYTNTQQEKWIEETNETRTQLLYVYLMKLLVENTADANIVSEFGQHIVTQKIDDVDLLAQLPLILDMPVMITEKATYDVSVEYRIDDKTGFIMDAMIKGTIQDLGKTYHVKSSAKFKTNDKLETIEVDIAAENKSDSDSDALSLFKKSNPADAVYYYEALVSTIKGDTESVYVQMINTLKGNVVSAIQADVGEQLQNFQLIMNNIRYAMKDNQVETSPAMLHDYYGIFVGRFESQYDTLSLMESTNDQVLTYREAFETLTSFKEVVGDIDISSIDQGEDALYAIEYTIDGATHKLRAVHLWSAVDGSTDIDHVITVYFDKFNRFNPTGFRPTIDSQIWQKISEAQ